MFTSSRLGAMLFSASTMRCLGHRRARENVYGLVALLRNSSCSRTPSRVSTVDLIVKPIVPAGATGRRQHRNSNGGPPGAATERFTQHAATMSYWS